MAMASQRYYIKALRGPSLVLTSTQFWIIQLNETTKVFDSAELKKLKELCYPNQAGHQLSFCFDHVGESIIEEERGFDKCSASPYWLSWLENSKEKTFENQNALKALYNAQVLFWVTPSLSLWSKGIITTCLDQLQKYQKNSFILFLSVN